MTSTLAEKARAKHSMGGIQFIDHKLLGSAPFNRSGLMCSGFHVHDVVASIKSDGLSRKRYRDATVVQVPAEHMHEFREKNRAMCEGDELMPLFAENMKYALLTKNHFVHAVKLFSSASQQLHGTKEIIKPNTLDLQLKKPLGVRDRLRGDGRSLVERGL